MNKNIGNIDRALRLILAVAVGVLYFQGVINGLVAAILSGLAAVLIITSLASRCPLYLPFGLSTREPGT